MLGFNRRHDANAMRMKHAIDQGVIGSLKLMRITSYDPSPPPAQYLAESGGLFCDMAIHDFDMARYLMNNNGKTTTDDEVSQVFASGVCHDPDIATVGDIDTAFTILKFRQSNVMCCIENTREAAYGYDQRMEVLGTRGSVSSDHVSANSVKVATSEHISQDLPHHFFLDRYMDSYVVEMKAFVNECARHDGKQDVRSSVGMRDGLEALRIAKAADLSLRENRPVQMSEIPTYFD